jgi:hypothetical protein
VFSVVFAGGTLYEVGDAAGDDAGPIPAGVLDELDAAEEELLPPGAGVSPGVDGVDVVAPILLGAVESLPMLGVGVSSFL